MMETFEKTEKHNTHFHISLKRISKSENKYVSIFKENNLV